MSKPIEWTTMEPRLPAEMNHVLQVRHWRGAWSSTGDATPADLIAALAAMPAEEREKVLRELDAGPPTAPSWLSDAAEALGEVRPEDGAPLALNWTQVVRAIYDQRAERDNWRARAEKAERRVNELLDNLGELAAQRNRETIRANEAERERDRMGAEFGCCPGEIPDDGEIARVVRERGEFRDRAEKAERERDEALKKVEQVAADRNTETLRANRAEKALSEARGERDEARLELDRARASLDVVRHDLNGTRQELGEARDKLAVRGVTADAFRAATDRAEAALRAERTACDRAEKAERERDEAVALQDVAVNRLAALELERDEALAKLRASYQTEADNDSILLHRIALMTAERDSALAQLKDRDDELSRLRAQPPRSYPLAEGSRWIENVIRDADGSQSWLAGGQVVTDGPLTGGLRYTYRQSARDLAALLAKAGLL